MEGYTSYPYSDMFWNLIIFQYVGHNPDSPKTLLFSLLALLKVYVPESYLLMSECQQILGPPDFIYGGPPFEERMEPFSVLITTSSPRPGHVCMIDQTLAQRAVELLAELRIYRSATLRKFMRSLCGDQAQPHVINFIKDLLTKRETGEKGKEKFSRLIEDILREENFKYAVSVLTVASDKFRQIFIFPQTIARLNYIKKWTPDYERAEEWAERAIQRAPRNSYVADTLGQVYKNRLIKETKQQSILNMARKAFRAFKDVERKAEREVDPEMRDIAGTEDISKSFNNRGFFGFMQVAKIVFDKLSEQQCTSLVQNTEVEDKFDFFEWYLTYSRPSMRSVEPHFFWQDVALCYKHYTTKTAAESTSFPGLLDYLNHGLFTSRGKRAGFEEDEKTVSDLEEIQDLLKTTYEEQTDDVSVAERYILSNIILSNRMPDSPRLTPVNELQRILHRFLGSPEGHRSPEFYLLVLLLFWPEEQPQVVQEEDDEEVEQEATEDNGTWEDEDSNEESETEGQPAQLPLNFMFDPDLQQYVTFMKRAYERGSYAKYLRGRYLLPLFFLGKGSGLSKWIHKSRLDAIVEGKVDDEQPQSDKEKVIGIKNMWISGEVWQVPEIQEILLPVRCCVKKASVEAEPSVLSPILYYLGFTIRGPVFFKVPHVSTLT